MTHKAINVSSDFSRFPAGRYISDGRFSGESFREKFLVPALQSSSIVEVHLDGTLGYGSSFLEEAFGGLVRNGFSAEDLAGRLRVRSNDDTLLAEISQYLKFSVH